MEQWASASVDPSTSIEIFRYGGGGVDVDATWLGAGCGLERRFPDEKGRLVVRSAGTRNAQIVWGTAVALLGDRNA